jgi:EpsI family protein
MKVKGTTARLLALTITMVSAAAVLRATEVRVPVPLHEPLADLPARLGEWHAVQDAQLDKETLAELRADDYVSRTYVSQGVAADLFVGFWASQQQGDTIHSPMNCLPGAGWQPLSKERTKIDAGGTLIDANRYVVQKGLDKRLVLYWYQGHGRTIASEYWSKFYLVADALRLHRSDAALVRVIMPASAGEMEAEQQGHAFIRAFYPMLDQHLPK